MFLKTLRRLNDVFLSAVPFQAELAMIAGFMLELVRTLRFSKNCPLRFPRSTDH